MKEEDKKDEDKKDDLKEEDKKDDLKEKDKKSSGCIFSFYSLI